MDLDGAIQMGQRMIESGYVSRVSRALKAQEVRHFGRAQKAKREFRGGESIYRFDTLRISPYLVSFVLLFRYFRYNVIQRYGLVDLTELFLRMRPFFRVIRKSSRFLE